MSPADMRGAVDEPRGFRAALRGDVLAVGQVSLPTDLSSGQAAVREFAPARGIGATAKVAADRLGRRFQRFVAAAALFAPDNSIDLLLRFAYEPGPAEV